MTTTIELRDQTNLDPGTATAWVAGWINAGSDTDFGVLQADGTFSDPAATLVPFYQVSAMSPVVLSVATNGNYRLLFVVSLDQPATVGSAN